MKKALMNASVASMIYKFNMNNIEILESLGYQVDVACNFGKENPISQEQIDDFKSILKKKHIRAVDTICPRNIFAIGKMVKAYKQLKRLADMENYDLVHTQSPIGGVLCRLAFRKARKKGTKVIYQAHGFHFYKGAPIQNWLIFYPIEKFCSRFTDVLITINKEDYALAQKKMKAKKVVYVPGVGIDLEKSYDVSEDRRQQLRSDVRIGDDDVLLFSIGELNENKNHSVVIKALGYLYKQEQYKNVQYAIAGKGIMEKELKELANSLGISDKVHLLGFRTDVADWYGASDVFVFPSHREGLSVSLMEAMASGLPCVVSKIRGNIDLVDEGNGGFLFESKNVEECKKSLLEVLNEGSKETQSLGKYNQIKVKKFGLEEVIRINKDIYCGEKY